MFKPFRHPSPATGSDRTRLNPWIQCLIVWVCGWCCLVSQAEPLLQGLQQHPAMDPRLKGRVWIHALGCTACHASSDPAFQMPGDFPVRSMGNYIHAGWMQQRADKGNRIHANPNQPDFLTHLQQPERVRALQSLTGFIQSKWPSEPSSTQAAMAGSAEEGDTLYHTIGCAVCHGPADSDHGKQWMQSIQGKYRPGALIAFLKDPLSMLPDGRMPDMKLSHQEAVHLAAFLNPATSELTPESVALDSDGEGQRWFETLQCHACHEVEGMEKNTSLPGLEALNLEKGCLSDKRGAWPDYALSDEQRHAIRLALNHAQPFKVEERIESMMTAYQCILCHQRDGVGGISTEMDAYVTSSDPNLGDQGRLPPTLDGVGAKLNPVWLRKILVQGAVSRPYMHTRMPRFGAPLADLLVPALTQTDELPDVEALEMPRVNDSKQAGRTLAGTQGMGCVTCHAFKGIQSGAMGAVDLTLLGQRLTRRWFHHYLARPQRFSPGTLMPEFWPEGVSSKQDVLEGSSAKQIEALWMYLSDGYSTGAPRGVHREPMRLLASEEEAVMLRRAYRGVGKRGIGVGYPHAWNLVFHAEHVGLAMLWQGEFADPAGVWLSQGHGSVRPLARTQIPFPNAPQAHFLDQPDASWPLTEKRSPDHRFKGYRLDPQRRPTFLYQVKDIAVEDTFREHQTEANGPWHLKRRIAFKSSATPASPLIYRMALSPTIREASPNRFVTEKGLHILLNQGGEAYLVLQEEGTELRISVPLSAGEHLLELEYRF